MLEFFFSWPEENVILGNETCWKPVNWGANLYPPSIFWLIGSPRYLTSHLKVTQMWDDGSHDASVLLRRRQLCGTNVHATLASCLSCMPGHIAGGGVIEQLISSLFPCFPEARALHLHLLHHSMVWCVTSRAEWPRFSLRHQVPPSHSCRAQKWKITHCLFIIKAD